MRDPISRSDYPRDAFSYRDLEQTFFVYHERNRRLKASLSWRMTLPVRDVRRHVLKWRSRITRTILALRNIAALLRRSDELQMTSSLAALWRFARSPAQIDLDYHYFRRAHPIAHLPDCDLVHRRALVILGEEALGSPSLAACRRSLAAQRKCDVEVVALANLTSKILSQCAEGSFDLVLWLRNAAVLTPDYIQIASRALGGTKYMAYADHDTRLSSCLHEKPFFKPDFSPVLLETVDYLAAGCALDPRWFVQCMSPSGREDASHSPTSTAHLLGPQRELFNRLRELAPSEVVHLPLCLSHLGPSASCVTPCFLSPTESASVQEEAIAIIIPTAFKGLYISNLLSSIARTTQDVRHRLEIVIITCEASGQGEEILRNAPVPVQLIRHDQDFNYATVNNLAAAATSAEILIFLNDDIEVHEPGWIESLEVLLRLPGAGAVGALLRYPDGTIQHAGCLIGMNGGVGHIGVGLPPTTKAAHGVITARREVSAVTGACLAVSRAAFVRVGGFDENLPLSFNDIAFCLSLRALGYTNYIATSARITHHESLTRGQDDTVEKYQATREDYVYARSHYPLLRSSDPYYSLNLSLSRPYLSSGDPPSNLLDRILNMPEPGARVILAPRKDYDKTSNAILESLSRAKQHGPVKVLIEGDGETRFSQRCRAVLGDTAVEHAGRPSLCAGLRHARESLLILDLRLLDLADGLPPGINLIGLCIDEGRVMLLDIFGDTVARASATGQILCDISSLMEAVAEPSSSRSADSQK